MTDKNTRDQNNMVEQHESQTAQGGINEFLQQDYLKPSDDFKKIYQDLVQMIQDQINEIEGRLKPADFELIVYELKQFIDAVRVGEISMRGKYEPWMEPILKVAVRLVHDKILGRFDVEEVFIQHCYTMIVTGEKFKDQQVLSYMADVVMTVGFKDSLLDKLHKKINQTFKFEYEHRFNEFVEMYFQDKLCQ